MKEKTFAALSLLRALVSENLGIVIIWAVTLAFLLKLGCV
jgi:hypothetical protein